MKSIFKKMAAACAAFAVMAALLLSGAMAAEAAAVYSAADLFTSRDLAQEADLSDAVFFVLSDGQDIRLTAGGVYVLTGDAKNVTVYVEAGQDDKVQIVLDGVSVTNTDFPVIYAKSADKVFVTTSGDSSLSVTGRFTADGSTNTDGVIFSKCDLVLNGTAVLTVSSTQNGIVGKDDLKITGGVYSITAYAKAIQANDSIRMLDGTLYLIAGTDGLHAENDDDDALGYVYIGGGSLTIQAGDDGIHATSVAQIDGGSLTIQAAEGIEGTWVQLNGGTIQIQAGDDGINAARKSRSYAAAVEINGGDITVVMGSGDTDGIDSNGSITVSGGTVNVTGRSTFDCDGAATYNGGTIIVNGQQVAYIPNQQMGGRGSWGGMNGDMNGGMNGGRNGGWGGRGGRGW